MEVLGDMGNKGAGEPPPPTQSFLKD